MNRFLLIASLLCVDIATRDKLLGLFTGVSQNAFANETGVLRFGLFIPRNEPNSTLLYSIEEYANQDAFNSHLATKPVTDMFTWINSANIYQRPAVVYNVTYSEDLEFIRPEVAQQADPYVVLRELDLSEGKLLQFLPLLKDVVNTSKNETGTLLSAVYTDPSNSTRLFTLEASTTREYFLDVHSESQAYLNFEKNSRVSENGTEAAYLKLKGGFVYKGK